MLVAADGTAALVSCCADTTRKPRGPRTVRTSYVYQPPAYTVVHTRGTGQLAPVVPRSVRVRRTRTSLGRIVRTAYRVAP